MPGIDESRPFVPVNIAILTVSDTRTLDDDRSGDTLVQRLTDAGHILADRKIVTDDVPAIAGQLTSWIDDDGIDVVISTGGTGVTGRDVTPSDRTVTLNVTAEHPPTLLLQSEDGGFSYGSIYYYLALKAAAATASGATGARLPRLPRRSNVFFRDVDFSEIVEASSRLYQRFFQVNTSLSIYLSIYHQFLMHTRTQI